MSASFLPVIDSKIINKDKKYRNNKQQIFKINFQGSSEFVIVEKENSNIDIGELYQSLYYKNKESMKYNGYIIITADDLKDAVISSDFIDWKTSIGLNVKIVSITDPEIINQPGVDLAEQIRNFLREYYTEWDVKYVLFVGNDEKLCYQMEYETKHHHNQQLLEYLFF